MKNVDIVQNRHSWISALVFCLSCEMCNICVSIYSLYCNLKFNILCELYRFESEKKQHRCQFLLNEQKEQKYLSAKNLERPSATSSKNKKKQQKKNKDPFLKTNTE